MGEEIILINTKTKKHIRLEHFQRDATMRCSSHINEIRVVLADRYVLKMLASYALENIVMFSGHCWCVDYHMQHRLYGVRHL
jgi:hypothetical protein